MDEAEIHPLLQAAQRGELEAFDQLASAAFPGVYDFIAGLEPDADSAARLATESLTFLAEMLGSLNSATWRSGVFSAAWRVLERERYLTTPDEDWETAPGVRDAVASLGPRRGALLDLHLRHGLTAIDLARVLGVSRSAGRLVVRRLLVSAETEYASRSQSLATYGQRPLVVAPVRLRAGVLAAVRLRWPGPRPLPLRAAPPPLPPPASHARGALPLASGLLVAAIALGVSLLAPASPIALTRKSDAPLAASQPTSASTVIFVTATARPTSTRTPTPTRTIAGTATRTAVSTATPRAASPSPSTTTAASPSGSPTHTPATTATATATTTPSQPPTPTAIPCVATIFVNVSVLTAVAEVDTFFPLFNSSSCGAASYTVLADEDWVRIEPHKGQIVPLGKVDIHVLANPPPTPGEYRFRLTITAPGQPSLFVEVRVTRN